MTDYLPLLQRAVTNLERNSGEARRTVYDRARQALVGQLRAMRPPLAESEITRERLALEEAIRRIESQTTEAQQKAEREPPPPPEPPRAPIRPPARAAAKPASKSTIPAPRRETVTADSASGSRVTADAVAEAGAIGEVTAKTSRSARDKLAVAPSAFDIDEMEEQIEMISLDSPAETKARAPRDEIPPRSPREPIRERARDNGRPTPEESFGVAPLQPRALRPRKEEVEESDARKAMRAKVIVGGIIAGLLLISILIGYVHRMRIIGLLGGSPSQTRTTPASRSGDDFDRPKIAERITPDQSVQSRPQTPPQNAPAPGSLAAVAQRAVLYEENPSGGQQLQTFAGTAVWRTETVNPGPGRSPELGIRVEIEVPDRHMTVTMTFRRNPDTTLPASHTVEIQFVTPNDPFGGVSNLPGIRAKSTETAQGTPLIGQVVKVMPGFFLLGLSAIDVDREQNLSLLRERGWLDVPFVYNNGRRAVIVLEKGTPGERAVNEAISAWGG